MSANSVHRHLHKRYVTEFIQKQPVHVLHHYLIHMQRKAQIAYNEFDHMAATYYLSVEGFILETIQKNETTTR